MPDVDKKRVRRLTSEFLRFFIGYEEKYDGILKSGTTTGLKISTKMAGACTVKRLNNIDTDSTPKFTGQTEMLQMEESVTQK